MIRRPDCDRVSSSLPRPTLRRSMRLLLRAGRSQEADQIRQELAGHADPERLVLVDEAREVHGDDDHEFDDDRCDLCGHARTDGQCACPEAAAGKNCEDVSADLDTLRACLALSDECRDGVRRMLAILDAPDADEQERRMAEATIIEALRPLLPPREGTLLDMAEVVRLRDWLWERLLPLLREDGELSMDDDVLHGVPGDELSAAAMQVVLRLRDHGLRSDASHRHSGACGRSLRIAWWRRRPWWRRLLGLQ